MNQIDPLVSIQCPEHDTQIIGTLDTNPNTEKLGYCLECILECNARGPLPQTLRTFPKYLQETSDFYKKCRQRVHDAGEPPAEYVDELSKKAERLEKLSQHVDQEKPKVKKAFDEIRKSILEIIDLKEKECLQLLEDEISNLSNLYGQFEKLLTTRWMKASDIDAVYPTADVLEQKMSRIVNIDQLQEFMKGVTEDIQLEKRYYNKKNSLEKAKEKINSQISCLKRFDFSFPQLQSKLLNAEGLENVMKELLKDFSREEIRVEDSLAPCGSQIADKEQDEVLRGWLPSDHKDASFKLLDRGSEDGMPSQNFHEKCDDEGATITLVKSLFKVALSSTLIGLSIKVGIQMATGEALI